MKKFMELVCEDKFTDDMLKDINMMFPIISDHVYMIYNKSDTSGRIVIAEDQGNGHGKVLFIFEFNEIEYNKFINQSSDSIHAWVESNILSQVIPYVGHKNPLIESIEFDGKAYNNVRGE